jgi:hypothetical protein
MLNIYTFEEKRLILGRRFFMLHSVYLMYLASNYTHIVRMCLGDDMICFRDGVIY